MRDQAGKIHTQAYELMLQVKALGTLCNVSLTSLRFEPSCVRAGLL